MRAGLAIDWPGADGPGHAIGRVRTRGSLMLNPARSARSGSSVVMIAPGGSLAEDSIAGTLLSRSAAVLPSSSCTVAVALVGPAAMPLSLAPGRPFSLAASANQDARRSAGSRVVSELSLIH